MNVRKRGLALLMCICMIFTLLPFSALADATTQDVVYGRYGDDGKWREDKTLTAESSVKHYPAAGETSDNDANIDYSKTAVKNNDGSYNVTLTIKSKTSETPPGASAVVLVIDNSGSMGDHQRLAKAKEAAKKFVDDYGTSGKDRYIALVSFADSANKYNFGDGWSWDNWFPEKVYWLDASNENNRGAINASIQKMRADGGTNLEQGLSTANDLFKDNAISTISKSNKYVIALTDGEPTFYGTGLWGYEGGTGNSCNETTYKRTIAAADTLKKTAEYLYTVCYGAENETIDYSNETVGDFLANRIASPGKAYNAADGGDSLSKAFAQIYQSIEQGISSGFTVTDPMGEYVNLVSDSLTGNGYSVSGSTITWKPKNGDTVDNPDGSKTTTYTLTYKVTLGEVPEDGTYPLNEDTTLAFKDGDADKTLHFNVPGVYREAPKYTVTYKYIGDVPEGATDVTTLGGSYKKDATVTVAAKPSVDGWTFSGWSVANDSPTNPTITDNGQFNMPNGNVVLEGSWTKRTDLSYKVHHYLNGTTERAYPDETVSGQTFNTTVMVYPKGADANYTPVSTEATPVTITTGTNEVIFYYYKNVTVKPNDANKTYGDVDPAKFTATVSGLIKETDSLTYDFTRVPGEDVGGYEIHKKTGEEFQGYYKVTYEKSVLNITKRDVTFTGETGTKPYTGSTIELTGITNVGLIGGHSASNLTYSASGINVGGPYSGAFNVGANDVIIIDAENNDVSGNYNVTLVPGSLTIVKADAVIVEITGKTDTKVYNGLEQTFTGYDFVIKNNPNNAYKEADFSLKTGADVTASGTKVGKYTMGLTADSFVNNNANFDVTFVIVEDGSLTITPRPLTIIGESSDPSEITYDGQTHTYTKWSLSQATDNSGLVSGHQITGITYLLTGKDAGDYTGIFSGNAKIMSGEEDVTANYSIECVPGKMKIVPAEKIAVKIIGNHKEVWYNGQEQSVSGFTFEVADNTVTVELKAGHYAIAKGTNVKTYYMGLKSDDFTINHKNYKEVSVEIVDGYLTIKRHYTPNPPIMDEIIVEITGNSDSVVYDGTEHSVKGYTVKISDPRYTEADFTFTGKAEASGVNAGTYEMGLKAEQFKNTNARFTNVKFVIKADGVLTITPKDLTITAGSKTEYGPTPVTCDEWTVSGLAAGDKVESVKITGIQSVPGSSPNVPSDAVIKNAKGEDVTKNYAIKYVNGTLTMLEVLNKEDHFNYIIGTPEGLSLPTANVTRAEVATIFFRLMTDDARAKFDSLDNNFSDVAKGKWYNRAISTLANAGIIKGDPAGTYRPGDPITRAEMAAIIARFGDFKEGGKTFNDISGHWAQKYIELAASNGWINGNPDGTFKPNNNITRAETVAMINRVLDRQTKDVSDLLPVSQMTNWSDNMDTAKWYYRDMQEATNNHKAERVGNSIYEKWTEKLPDIDWASYQI